MSVEEEAEVRTNTTDNKKSNDKFKYQAAAFLTGVAGVSLLGGFGTTLGMTKKKDPNMFSKGIMGSQQLHEAGGALAMRALGRGTLYAVSGFSLFCFGMWKLIGAHSLEEFRMKAGNMLPRIPRNDPPQSRTEFSGLNDLFQYLIDEDARKKQEEIKASNTTQHEEQSR